MLLPVTPDVLDGVEFRRVGRKIGSGNPTLQTSNVVLHQSAAVSRQTVPHDQQRLVKVSHQSCKKVHDLFLLDGPGIDAKVEVPQCEPGSDRKSLPIKVVLQDGCLSPGRPGAATMRSLTQSAFVDENEDTPLPARFFFSSGHTFFFQLRICFSSRSRARPSGRCGLQPRPTRIFQTWPS